MNQRPAKFVEELIRIGDLARETDVPVATLRYYESEGLIQCVRARSRYRMFPLNTVETVRRILHLKGLKFPLGEIKQILAGGSGENGPEDYRVLQERLAHIREQKQVWEEQEQRVRVIMAAFPQDVIDGAGDV